MPCFVSLLICSWFKSCNYFPCRRCERWADLSDWALTGAGGGQWRQVVAGDRWQVRGHWTLDLAGLIKQYERSPPATSQTSQHPCCEETADWRPAVMLTVVWDLFVWLISGSRQGRVRWGVREAATSDTNYPILTRRGRGGEGEGED